MKEKTKTICLISITIAVLIISVSIFRAVNFYNQRQKIYIEAYQDCMKIINISDESKASFTCVRILNGGQ